MLDHSESRQSDKESLRQEVAVDSPGIAPQSQSSGERDSKRGRLLFWHHPLRDYRSKRTVGGSSLCHVP